MLLRERDRLAEISFPKGLARLLLIQDDPPRHAVMRRLVNKAFTARRIAQLEPWIRENAGELIAAMGEGEPDVIGGLGIPLLPTLSRYREGTLQLDSVLVPQLRHAVPEP